MAPPGKQARRYVISLYRDEADAMRDYGGGILSRGVRKAWRARSRNHRQHLDALLLAAIEADDMGEPITAHLSRLRAHLDGSPKPTRRDSITPIDGPPPEKDTPQNAL